MSYVEMTTATNRQHFYAHYNYYANLFLVYSNCNKPAINWWLYLSR